MLLLHQGNAEALSSKTQQARLDSRTERAKMLLLHQGNIEEFRTEQARLDRRT